ncbi:hypothetical protein PAEPH01_1656 [Pancytospora epiphaga]|nr:hypothetical protein PAEPH01_1656 [Pancytospora epiphaga]
MKACVMGAGPSGLYISQKLAERGIPVAIFEKSNEILGNYKYARIQGTHLQNIPNMTGIDLHLNTDKMPDNDCSFYVVATGGHPRTLDIPGADLCIPAIDIVKKYYNGDLKYLGDTICIIGMGNVTMDLLNYIKDKCKKVLVISSQNAMKTPFSNHLLRELVEGGDWKMSVIGEDTGIDEIDTLSKAGRYKLSGDKHGHTEVSRRGDDRRKDILRKLSDNKNKRSVDPTKPSIFLHFNTRAVEVSPSPDRKLELSYSSGGKLFKEVFDGIISSVGFIPNKISIETEKPVFYTGWCVDARGNIDDARRAAELCTEDIIQEIKM